jgi:hypothetical protein
MKFEFLKYLIAPAVFVAILAGLAFDRPNAPRTETVWDADAGDFVTYEYAAKKPIQGFTDSATLSSTTGKTHQIPYIFASNWQYEIYYQVKKISGTTNGKVVLDSRTITNGTWSPIDSISFAGTDSTKLHHRFRGVTYGSQYRTRLVKSGGQVTSTRIEYTFKPTD